jgi:hypothetical protein
VAVNETARRIRFAGDDPVPPGPRIFVNGRLRRRVTVALAESAVIDRKYRNPN